MHPLIKHGSSISSYHQSLWGKISFKESWNSAWWNNQPPWFWASLWQNCSPVSLLSGQSFPYPGNIQSMYRISQTRKHNHMCIAQAGRGRDITEKGNNLRGGGEGTPQDLCNTTLTEFRAVKVRNWSYFLYIVTVTLSLTFEDFSTALSLPARSSSSTDKSSLTKG